MKPSDFLTFGAALAISLLLWLQVQPLTTPGREKELPVSFELRGVPDSVVPVGAPESVTAIATGTADQLATVNAESLVAFADLSDAEPGTRRFAVQVEGQVEQGVELTAKTPAVEMTVEPRVTEQRQVMLEFTGTPPGAYQVTGGTVEPEEVEVTGPKSAMEQIDRVRVLFDLSGVRPGEEYQRQLEALAGDESPIAGLVFTPESVTLQPALSSKPADGLAYVNVVIEDQPAAGYRIADVKVEPEQIEITGAPQIVAATRSVRTLPVSVANLREERVFTTQALIPDGLAAESTQVKVTIVIRRG